MPYIAVLLAIFMAFTQYSNAGQTAVTNNRAEQPAAADYLALRSLRSGEQALAKALAEREKVASLTARVKELAKAELKNEAVLLNMRSIEALKEIVNWYVAMMSTQLNVDKLYAASKTEKSAEAAQEYRAFEERMNEVLKLMDDAIADIKSASDHILSVKA